VRNAAFLLLAAVGLVGCAPEPVTVSVNFPSQEAFLHSEFAQIQIFELSPTELGSCPDLLVPAIAGTGSVRPKLRSGSVNVCDLFDGGVSFDEVGEGPHAYVAVARNEANRPLLAGCTVGEVYADAPEIVVRLTQTSEYYSAVSGPPACSTVEDKCERGCGP